MYSVPFGVLAQTIDQPIKKCVLRLLRRDLLDDTRPCKALRSNTFKRASQAFSPNCFN
jgi:hypothetical protein